MSAGRLTLPAHAKLNLDLRVRGVRPDGQHEVVTHLQAISLHDRLSAEPAPRTSLEVAGLAIPDQGPGGENLVLRAAGALERACGRRLPARFRLEKRIPAGSGMGGGSSDAAAALRLLARLHGLDGRGGPQLHPIAAGLGADVAFFLRGGAALARGRGEVLEAAEPPARPWFAIAWPGFGISTAAVYRAWDEVGGEGRNQLQRAALRVEPRLAAFAQGLGPGWVMTGSGAAFYHEAGSEAEARSLASGRECWTAVAACEPAWS